MAFIRRKRVHKKTEDDRKNYFYYYRVANKRVEGQPRQIVLAYLGDASRASDRLAEESEVSDAERHQLQQLIESEGA